jgi:nifR3 family TIM-barrel protein
MEDMGKYTQILKRKEKIYALAPMEGVTDSVFRQVLCDIGKPDLFFTEFMNTDGYMSEGRDEVAQRLKFNPKERPIIFQLWGSNPDKYADTVKSIRKLKPDGIDINLGCSVRDVLSKGQCAALIKKPDLVKQIIKTVKKEAGDIPVSVKTRLGYNRVSTDEWIGFLLKQDLDLITVHGRIAKQGYDKPADWDEISKVVKLRDKISPDTIVLGNGDITDLDMADRYIKKYRVDGVMLARAVIQNPWVFSRRREIPKDERLAVLKKHLELFKAIEGYKKPFNTQKKYIKMYLNNFQGAQELRMKFMKCENIDEALDTLREII